MADDDIPNDVKEEVADVSLYFLFSLHFMNTSMPI